MKEEKQMQYPSLFKPLLILTSAAILLVAMHLAAPLLVPILLFATIPGVNREVFISSFERATSS